MSELPPELSLRAERAVARNYIGRFQWEMVAVGLGQFALWVTTCSLVFAGVVPLWLGFLVCTGCACFAYRGLDVPVEYLVQRMSLAKKARVGRSAQEASPLSTARG